MMSWAVFLSGRGSNAEALWENIAELDVRLVISNKANAYGISRARKMGIPILIMDRQFSWSTLTEELRKRKISRIFLLGFMKLVPDSFVQDWKGKIWNLHPSLLPAFPGLEALEKSYEAGGSMGVSLHQVTADLDAGPLELQYQYCSFSKKEMSLDEAKMKNSQVEQRLVRELARRKNCRGNLWI